MKRLSLVKVALEFLAVVSLELLAFVVLLRASPSLGSVPLGHFSSWVDEVSPQEALTALARLLGLVVIGWLLSSTVLYAVALLTGRPGLLRVSRPLTLPALRKLLDALATASMAASSLGIFAGSASAAPVLHQAAVVQQREVSTLVASSSVEAHATTVTTVDSRAPGPTRHLPHPGNVTHELRRRGSTTEAIGAVVPSTANGFAGLAAGTKVVVVQPGDCLSVLAQRHLGDWRLDQEIERLNWDHPQPDGRRLEDDHWIYPGWVLIMPQTAVGTLVVGHASHLPGHGTVAGPGHREPSNRTDTTVTVRSPHWAEPGPPIKTPAPTTPTSPPATTVPAAHRHDRLPVPGPPLWGHKTESQPAELGTHGSPRTAEFAAAMATVGVLASGSVIWKLDKLRRDRRHGRPHGQLLAAARPEVQAAERRARAISGPDATKWVDAAVRYLSGLVESRSLESADVVPSLVSIEVGPKGLKVTLSAAVTEAIGWFSPTSDDKSLVLDPAIDLEELEALAADRWPAWPALISLGSDDEGSTVLVNLEHLGSLAVEGPSQQNVTALLSNVALQLVSQPWAEEMLGGVHVIGPCPLDSGLGLQAAQGEEEAMALAEKLDGISTAHQEVAGGLSISTLRAVASEALPHVVLAFPGADQSAVQCLVEAAVPEKSAVAIVTAAPCATSRCRVVIDATGSASLKIGGQTQSEIIGIRVDYPAREVALLSEAVGAAKFTTGPAMSAPEADQTAGQATIDIRALGDAEVDADGGGTARPNLAAPTIEQGPVEISFLGPVELIGGEPASVEPGRQKAALSLISYLATHERLVTVEEIASALWPLDATKESMAGPQRKTVMNVISRARGLLGYRAGGAERLVYSQKGYRLTDDVTSDWGRFEKLLSQARRQPSADAARTLRRGLELVRGEPFTGAISSQFFEWVASEHLDFTIAARVVDAAQDLADIALAARDFESMTWAVNKGLQLEPTREELFRLWMHAFGQTGRPARVDDVYRRLKLVLRQRIHPLQEPQAESREVWRKYTAVELATNLYD